MKIIGFTQLHNELSKGNLKNWFRSLEFCDYIYIYDQASTDGSLDYYKTHKNTVVIESPTNDFEREIACKATLLEKLLKEHPDVDWVCWVDGDTILDGRMLRNSCKEVYSVLKQALKEQVDTIALGHYQLWRNDVYHRTDNDYDWLHNHGVKVFWRNTGQLRFIDIGGLHQRQFPAGLIKHVRIDRCLIHRGFATDDQILNRYELYKSKGQTGSSLDRLIDETTLVVQKIQDDILPDWYMVTDTETPSTKQKIRTKIK